MTFLGELHVDVGSTTGKGANKAPEDAQRIFSSAFNNFLVSNKLTVVSVSSTLICKLQAIKNIATFKIVNNTKTKTTIKIVYEFILLYTET